MSPVVLGRKDWRFTGSLRVGQRAAPVMNLIQSALLNVHGPYTYLSEGGGAQAPTNDEAQGHGGTAVPQPVAGTGLIGSEEAIAHVPDVRTAAVASVNVGWADAFYAGAAFCCARTTA